MNTTNLLCFTTPEYTHLLALSKAIFQGVYFTFGVMSYGIEDRSLFEPLSGPAERDDTSYFELHPKELPHAHACWLPGSFFVRDAAFDFFAGCFQSASESFDYFSFQRFGEVEIDLLLQELDQFLHGIAFEPKRERLFSRYASIFTPDIWSAIETEDLAFAVHQCGEKMRSFVQSNRKESRCLWVLGMRGAEPGVR